MVAAMFEDLLKVGRGLPVVVIIVIAAFFFIPETSKLYASTTDKLGISEPSIGTFTVKPLGTGNGFNVQYRLLGALQKIDQVKVTWHYKERSTDPESKSIQVNDDIESFLNMKSGAGYRLKEETPEGAGQGEIIISNADTGIAKLNDGKIHAGIYRFTLEIFGREGIVLDDQDATLELAEPYLTNVRADGYGNEQAIRISWGIPEGTATAENYRVLIRFFPNPPDKSPIGNSDFGNFFFSDKKLPLGGEVIAVNLGSAENVLRYPETGPLKQNQMGGYWATISVLNYVSAVTFAQDTYTGVYNNEFVETYRDLKGVEDACDADCDVAGKKENALGDDKFGWKKVSGISQTYTQLAFERNKASFQSSCSLLPAKKGQERISGCTNYEVDMLYTEVVRERVKQEPNSVQLGKTPDDLLKIDCVGETWMKKYDSLKNTAWKVCEAKDKLKKHLDKIGWAYAQ